MALRFAIYEFGVMLTPGVPPKRDGADALATRSQLAAARKVRWLVVVAKTAPA
jgi:hypothetical protein